MKKLTTILGAGALAFTLGGFAFAADEPAPAGDAAAAISGRAEEVRVAAANRAAEVHRRGQEEVWPDVSVLQ